MKFVGANEQVQQMKFAGANEQVQSDVVIVEEHRQANVHTMEEEKQE